MQSLLSAAGQVLKLPAGKYTVREREMMTGSGVPAEFFHATSALGKTVLIGTYTFLRGTSSLICVHHICFDSMMNKGSFLCTSLRIPKLFYGNLIPYWPHSLSCLLLNATLLLLLPAALGVAGIYSAFLWRQKQEPDDDSE